VKAVVLGIGNPLYGDDGFGLEALAELARSGSTGPEVELVDGGTEGLALLGCIEEATHLVILDVVEGDGLAAGQPVEYDAARLASGTPLKLSEHQVGVEEVLGLAVWRGRLPRHAVLLGVVPERLGMGWGLSETVRGAVPPMAARAARILAEWGCLGQPSSPVPE
jgi:hydrogenase maturation protease